MDSLESVLSNSSKLMIDIKEGNNLMLLPLDKIINSSEVSDEENSDETIEDFSSNESKQNNREGR